MSDGFGIESFSEATGVSRETAERFAIYDAVLRKWQARINLIGPSTTKDIWRRHFLDSAQLLGHLDPDSRVLVDLGSGAGFPGLVLAILGQLEVHLIESDTRKAAFLREAARETGTAVTVHARRIEAVPPFPADVVTARALARIEDLLAWGHPFISARGEAGGVALFLKGQNVEGELTDATKYWRMRAERFPSVSDPTGTVVRLSEISRLS